MKRHRGFLEQGMQAKGKENKPADFKDTGKGRAVPLSRAYKLGFREGAKVLQAEEDKNKKRRN